MEIRVSDPSISVWPNESEQSAQNRTVGSQRDLNSAYDRAASGLPPSTNVDDGANAGRAITAARNLPDNAISARGRTPTGMRLYQRQSRGERIRSRSGHSDAEAAMASRR